MTNTAVTLTTIKDIPLVQPGDDLGKIIVDALEASGMRMQAHDVLVVAQKIVSKAQGRYVDLRKIVPSSRAHVLAAEVNKDARLVEVILSESHHVVRHRMGTLIVEHKLGFVMANAGIDQSNIEQKDGEERVLLLPENPDGSCNTIKAKLDYHFGLELGVVINDSFGRAWRNGVVGVALGAAGIPSLLDRVGHPDLYGRRMRVTQVAIADEVAAAASLLMGQAAEGLPVVHVRGLVWEAPAQPAAALIRARELDMFR